MIPVEQQDYGYLLGREVAIIEKMFNYKPEFNLFGKVSVNPLDKLPYHRLKALKNERHNLHPEMVDVASRAFNINQKIPSFLVPKYRASYALGYYHELKHIQDTYPVLGIVEETTVDYQPKEIEIKKDNIVEELKK